MSEKNEWHQELHPLFDPWNEEQWWKWSHQANQLLREIAVFLRLLGEKALALRAVSPDVPGTALAELLTHTRDVGYDLNKLNYLAFAGSDAGRIYHDLTPLMTELEKITEMKEETAMTPTTPYGAPGSDEPLAIMALDVESIQVGDFLLQAGTVLTDVKFALSCPDLSPGAADYDRTDSVAVYVHLENNEIKVEMHPYLLNEAAQQIVAAKVRKKITPELMAHLRQVLEEATSTIIDRVHAVLEARGYPEAFSLEDVAEAAALSDEQLQIHGSIITGKLCTREEALKAILNIAWVPETFRQGKEGAQ